jgi:uncharacterized membrane protein
MEMMVVMLIAGLMLGVFANMLTPALNFFAKRDTATRLQAINAALNAAIADNAVAFASNPAQSVLTLQGAVMPLSPNANGQCQGGAGTFAALSSYMSASGDAWHDGSGRSFCIYVSPLLIGTTQATQFYFHSISVVSPGPNGVIDVGTGMSSAGVMNVAGDDVSTTINGQLVVGALVQGTLDVMARYATALSSYYQSRYLGNTGRDTQIDFWANASPSGTLATSWDADPTNPGLIPLTGGCAVGGVAVSGAYLLGFSQGDLATPFGSSLLLDNCSNLTRNPENPTLALSTPPYTVILTAQIGGPIPSISKTVFGVTN